MAHNNHLKMKLVSVRSWLLCLLVLTVVSCKSGKNVADRSKIEDLTARNIIDNHYENELDFKTLSGRIKIDYSEGASTQSVGVSLRMKKNEAIWISAPLGVIKAFITPERVSFYNKLQNEYFDGDYSYFSEMLGIEVDFFKIQNILLGQAFYDLRDLKFQAETNGDHYELKPKKSSELLKTLFFVEPENFKLTRQQLSQPEKKRLLDIQYKNYQGRDKKALPNEIGIMAIETMDRTLIDITYKNMEFDRELNFPYRIPRGYDEIVLNK